ncbi:MAG: peptidoglycan DD-metalloendopeptidase family protein [Gammaproteobacteria bacterium]|nr:peptidoglycan DD-metalloendopeptidase family protein [Gammaproteobacteria bacterium]
MTVVNTGRSSTRTDNFLGFPRRHLLLAAGLVLVFATLLSLGAGDVEANRKSVPLILDLEAAPAIAAELLPEETVIPAWQDYQVRSGDNLSLIFQRAGLDDGDVYHVVSRAPGGRSLTRIYPGQTLSFQISEQGELQALRYQQSRLTSVIYTRVEDAYEVENLVREPERHRSFASATIKSSLFLAGKDAGMTHNTIMELANIFGGVIDFVLDPRVGDKFHVLYEELYLDGEKLGDGEILAAEFINQGKRHTAFRYIDENGKVGYYSEDGVSMRKAFLLAPVDFTRISSNFNLRRLHPIYKTTRPHRGTDYAAPRGTPVFAAGDGRVVEAGYTRANGNYVVIKHGAQFTTKYLHLHKRKVKKGSRVEQQQIIGTVGSTGAATGPHLHYEFLLNGVHRNPRTIHKKLPKARSLAQAKMPRFRDQTRSLYMQLASVRQSQLARNSEPTSPIATL